jgi:integrase
MDMKKHLTDKAITTGKEFKPRDSRFYITDTGSTEHGHGALQLAIDPKGSRTWIFRYLDDQNRPVRYMLAPYGEGDGFLTLKQARDRADELAKIHVSNRDVRGFLRAQDRQKQAEQQARAKAELDESQQTLRKLCGVYVESLKAAGKVSHRDAANLFKNHVLSTEFADWPAARITADEVTDILRPLVAAGKGRSGGKVRSYLGAAFALAQRARTDAAAPKAIKLFGVRTNPVADTAALSQFNRTLERVLTDAELGAYLRRVRALRGVARDALLLALVLGGQRIAQILRITVADVDLNAKTLTLRDGKGRRGQPRLHQLPLTGEAAQIVTRLLAARADRVKKAAETERTLAAPDLLFSASGKAVDAATVSGAVHDIAVAMTEADPAEAASMFSMSTLRRTCETRLAELRISSDVRAQVLSHNLGNLQTRSYDRYSYFDEKLRCLAIWGAKLEKVEAGVPATNVVNFPGAAAAQVAA